MLLDAASDMGGTSEKAKEDKGEDAGFESPSLLVSMILGDTGVADKEGDAYGVRMSDKERDVRDESVEDGERVAEV